MARRLSGTHHARWMGSCLYILKMLIVGQKFFLGAQQQQDLVLLSLYIGLVHFFHWFSCTKLCNAPVMTLQLRQDLKAWAQRDPKASKDAIRKLDLHVDYVHARHVTIALASPLLKNSEKQELATTILKNDPRDENGNYPEFPMGKPEMPRVYGDSRLPDFVSEESWLVFEVSWLPESNNCSCVSTLSIYVLTNLVPLSSSSRLIPCSWESLSATGKETSLTSDSASLLTD